MISKIICGIPVAAKDFFKIALMCILRPSQWI